MERIRYYSDDLNDDFALNHITTRKLEADFRYVRDNVIWRACGFLLFHLVAKPLTFCWLKVKFHQKFVDRGLVKPFRKTGYFIYANHTNGDLDAFVPAHLSSPKKAFIVCSPDATSIRGLRNVVMMLGGIPTFTAVSGGRKFKDAIKARIGEGKAVAIYPEAHIWPYYTDVRPFKDVSMTYPCELSAPCFALTNIYMKRRFSLSKRPRVISLVSGPFYPDPDLPLKEARRKLRDEIYGSMKTAVHKYQSYEYIKYVKKEK